MKPPEEIQHAHDLLTQMLLDDDLREALPEGSAENLMKSANVLCWVLGHDHNKHFDLMLTAMEMFAVTQGCFLIKEHDVPQAPSGERHPPSRSIRHRTKS